MTNDAILRVSVNGIEVGSLPEGLYEEIRKDVRRNKWLYVRQGFSFLNAILVVLSRFLAYAAILSVLFSMLVAVASPDTTATVWAALMKATPDQVANGFRSMAGLVLFVTGLCMLAMLCLKGFSYFGAVDVFQREINHYVRTVLEVPSEGPMTIRADAIHSGNESTTSYPNT